MNYKPALSILLICTLLSCQKELSFTNGTTPINPIVNDSVLVSQLLALDTTKASGLDTVFKYLAYYDAQKRITNNILIEFDNTGSVLDTFFNQTYYYTGSDSLPYKTTIFINEYMSTSNRDTNYYTYANTAGRELLYDSIVTKGHPPFPTNHRAEATKYVYAGNFIRGMRNYYDQNIPSGNDTLNAHITKINGNITSQTDTLDLNPFGGFAQARSYTLSFDNHFNPLRGLNLKFPYLGFEIPFLGDNIQAKNVTQVKLILSYSFAVPDDILHYQYSYKYRADGYPLEIVAKDLGSTNPIRHNKIRYFYTK